MDFALSASERGALESVIACGKDVRQVKRAQALLALAAGDTVSAIANSWQVARNTVYNWVERFQERTGPLDERLSDAQRCGRPGDLIQSLRELLPELLAQKPTEFGYRHAEWTVDLLQVHLREKHQLEASDRTIRHALHDVGYRWKRPRYGPRRRAPTWRQSKGGCSAA
jgi:transposase